jgi:L-ornithine Nalpha-acyltransferase
MAITVLDKKKGIERLLEVRIAENQFEIEQTLALRYNIFNLEMGEGLPESRSTSKDRDEYDYFCDHLIVMDKTNNQIAGTYRILRREIAKKNIGFYSETEFNLEPIYNLKEEVAEVGRSCVHEDYRDGSVISLLWAGLGEYMHQYNLRYLMGCGSIHSTDANSASEVYAYLRSKNSIASEELDVKPLESHKLEGFNPNLEVGDISSILKKIPPIIKGYVRIGATLSSAPALDRVFNTTDVFVLFDRKEVDTRYGKHYL